MRGFAKPSVEKRPNPSVGKNAQWPDLKDSLESWSATFEGTNDRVPQSTIRVSPAVGPKSGIFRALDQQDNPQAGNSFGQFAAPGEQWGELAARINLRPEIVAHAENVVGKPQAEERVLNTGEFPASSQES